MREKPLYALSIRQPWAWLICKGYKGIENRPWRLPREYIGVRIFIHASKSKSEIEQWVFDTIKQWLTPEQKLELKGLRWKDVLNFGCIIGEATLTGCVTESDSPWFVGEYGFILADPVLYDKPIPCRGRLGFFKPELEVE